MAFYGAENWTHRTAEQKYWKGLECGAGEGRKRSVGPTM